MQEVSLSQMLYARERRRQQQMRLIAEYGNTVVSFSLNIPGPVKNSPLIRRAYYYGKKQLLAGLRAADVQILTSREQLDEAGCELIMSVSRDAMAIKRICLSVEDSCSLGRLFDMDVLSAEVPEGRIIERAALGKEERGCIVCGKKGRSCASRRLHSIEQLQRAVRQIIYEHFLNVDVKDVAVLATKALFDEVCTTPKPGLVDRDNSGSHCDMDIFTYSASTSVLAGYWEQCVRTGIETKALKQEDTFKSLRRAGIAAERDMFAATGGINTHKGIIFSLGIVCGAIGRLWNAESPERDPERIMTECAAMTKSTLTRELKEISNLKDGLTHGEQIYQNEKLEGVRGEVAQGFPDIREISLPAFQKALSEGVSRNDAGVAALLSLIAVCCDSNMISRGGMSEAKRASEEAASLIEGKTVPDMESVRQLDRSFAERNLSPGGCADLLAVTYFLHDWETGSSDMVS